MSLSYCVANGIQRIAIGSCNDISKWHLPNATQWVSAVQDWHPDAFIWLGDVVYADQRTSPYLPFFWTPAAPEGMDALYQRMKTHPTYKSLVSSLPGRVWGVWDDHDYGNNDGGASYVHREQAKKIYLDFIDEPKQSIRWNQEGGLYTSYVIGSAPQRVKVILLDVRFSKEGQYGEGDILGDAQWKWLERELDTTKLSVEGDWQLLLVGSGIQVLPVRKPIQEKWGTYPESRQRLLNLLQRATEPRQNSQFHRRVLLISGDVHYGEFLRHPAECADSSSSIADIYEMTSSGLTHSCGTASSPFLQPLQHAVCLNALNTFMKTPQHVEESFVALKNWGGIEIDWDKQTVTLTLRPVDGSKPIFRSLSLPLNATVDLDSPKLGHAKCAEMRQGASLFHLVPFEHWKWLVLALALSILVVQPLFCCYCLFCRGNAPRGRPKQD